MKEPFIAICPKCSATFKITLNTKGRSALHADGVDIIKCPFCGYEDDGWSSDF